MAIVRYTPDVVWVAYSFGRIHIEMEEVKYIVRDVDEGVVM